MLAAEQKILAACRRQNIAPGYHVVPPKRKHIDERIAAGYRFIGCSLDTQFIMSDCRALLKR